MKLGSSDPLMEKLKPRKHTRYGKSLRLAQSLNKCLSQKKERIDIKAYRNKNINCKVLPMGIEIMGEGYSKLAELVKSCKGGSTPSGLHPVCPPFVRGSA